ncbi:MAG: DUF485 domain-containing protein [Syntrophotaleaceae bacterium]
MGHGPAVKLGKDNASGYKTKLGIWMFLFYTLIYAIFVGINSVNPALMEVTIMGQTLAVVFGFGLIIIAFIMAIIYNYFCNSAEARLNK